jgi:hypothetical protein
MGDQLTFEYWNGYQHNKTLKKKRRRKKKKLNVIVKTCGLLSRITLHVQLGDEELASGD